MSTREAMRFIEALSTDHVLRERLRRGGRSMRLEEVALLANDAGYRFTVGELQRAFVEDWQMRRRFYSAAGHRAEGSPEQPA